MNRAYAFRDAPFYIIIYPFGNGDSIRLIVCPNANSEYINLSVGSCNIKTAENIHSFTNAFEYAKMDFNAVQEDIHNIFELYERYKDNKL